MKAKLSPAQIRVLKALAEPERSIAHFLSGFDAYWFFSSHEFRPRFDTMEKLISLGLLDIEKDDYGRYKTARINQAGREYLKEEGAP
jgi:hypothetical protein